MENNWYSYFISEIALYIENESFAKGEHTW